jgi:hypothetical protein
MKQFPHFNKQQLELLIASITFTSFELSGSDNLAKTIVDFDYTFEHHGFNNPLNKRLLVSDPITFSSNLFNPLMDAFLAQLQLLTENDNKPELSLSVASAQA